MKAYTDLKQSKILAEFLPIESADMHYATWTILDGEFIVSPNQGETIENLQEDYGDQIIPCWSLAALFDVLPLEIEMHKQTDGYKIYYYVELYIKCMGNETYLSTERHENLIDACYEMIIQLKERNLL